MRQLLLCAGLLGLPATPNPAQQPPPPQSVHDDGPRLARLRSFFHEAHSVLHRLAPVFIEVADRHGLDWRLLPSISMVETGCGRTAQGNNIFGWDSGRRRFASAREAINMVASWLAHSKLYRGKDLDEKLATYNPRPEYAELVHSVMKQLGPPVPAKAPYSTQAELSPASSSRDITRPEPIQ